MTSSHSKLLSLVLRHHPEKINITLDEKGWANTNELLEKINKYIGIGSSLGQLDLKELEKVVKENNKQRFSFNEDKSMIRANQGHSIKVDLELKEAIPPAILYHGTAKKSIPSILKTGIDKRKRNHVHLSDTIELATTVGSRHGEVEVLAIKAMAMRAEGHKFYLSENKVWLTDFVPVEFIQKMIIVEKIIKF